MQSSDLVSSIQPSQINTLLDLLQTRAGQHPDRLVFRFLQDSGADAVTITYGELDSRARAIGAWLEHHNANGERALILYPPGLDYIASFFGCLYAGVTAVPAYPPRLNRPAPRIQSMAADSKAKFALTTSTILHNIEQRFVHAPELGRLNWLDTEQVPAGIEADWRRPNISSDTLAFLQYTSGSTSQPKGVMLSHGNLMHNLKAIQRGFQIDSSAVGVFWLPSYHDMGLIGGILEPIHIGAHSNLMSPVSFLQRPFRWLEAISEYKATISGAPNFAYDLCVDKIPPEQIATLDLSSWTLAFCGAEPIRPETLERFSRTFELCGFRKSSFYPCFGMAENTLIVSGGEGASEPRTMTIDRKSLEQNKILQASVADENALALVNCGKSIIDQRIKVVNPNTLEECASDEIGEIWVMGPSVAQGYWGLEEETKDHFQARITNTGEGPFLRTGDLGFLYEGELFITGRLKDLIIIHGSNHYPQDIELTVESAHVALQPAGGAAFSVTDEGREKLVIVQEVTRQNRSPDIDEVTSAIRQAVAEKHDLQVFAIVLIKPMSIPKTSSGKIQRRATKNAFLNGVLDVVGEWRSSPSSPSPLTPLPKGEGESGSLPPAGEGLGMRGVRAEEIQTFLLTRIASLLEMDASSIDPRQPFTYYGLGSVQAVSLTGDLETFLNRKLSPTLAWDYPTVELLANHLATDSSQQTKATQKPTQPTQTYTKEPIAIIGMSCRFPQAPNPQAFWELLRNGVDAVTEVPSDRWDIDALHSENPDPGKVTTRFGAFLEDVDLFDPAFFGISPREAARMDPQQRLLLEVSWEALENAFIPPQSLAGTRTGVFIGISSYDYSRLQFDNPELIDAYAGTGNAHSIAANRLSYVYDLRGPSMAVDTACSSSLVSTHLAVQSLRNGESDLALAGGVNLILTPELTITFSQARMLSPDGHCKTFDANADGYVRGEGCGVIVLKRLSDALRDGDHILALIRGSAVNQDGRSNGLTAPNGLAQQDVIRYALADAGVAPGQIGYVEAHGTGTPLGDPIEISSLRTVLDDGESNSRVLVGSVKTNIGHLESAAGIAGLIKSVLALQNESLPPHLHLKEVNPYLSLEDSRLEIGTYLRPWKRREGPRFAGISSFGFGGTNAHIIISDGPDVSLSRASRHEGSLASTDETLRSAQSDNHIERPRHILTLSAKSESALRELSRSLSDQLPITNYQLSDLAFTANTARSHFEHRLAFHASTNEELKNQLDAFINNPASTPINHAEPKVVFLFTGQGSQYSGVGRTLYETQPVFRAALDKCAAILDPILNRSLHELLFSDSNDIHQTQYTQPALFAVEYALAQTWLSWGVVPHAVLGHSVGEYVAACIAGVFSLEDGLRLIAERARLMGSLPHHGTMAAVFTDADRVAPLLQPYLDRVSIAATNGPDNTVISGETSAVQTVLDELTKLGISSKPLTVSHAFHSPLMDPILDEFESFARDIQFSLPRIPLGSNLLGGILKPDQTPNARYWRDHIRSEVKFAQGMEAISSLGIDAFIEIGPAPVLLGMGKRCLPESKASWLPSLRQNQDDWQIILDGLGKLYVQGADIDWKGFDEGYTRHKVALPNYPFDRQRYWIEGSTVNKETRKQVNKVSTSSNGKVKEHEENSNGRKIGRVKNQPPPASESTRSALLAADPSQRQKLLQEFIQTQAARVLGMDVSRLSLDQSLDTMGLDSLMAMELKNSLDANLKAQLPISSLLQGPTVASLAAQILEHLETTSEITSIPSIAKMNGHSSHPLTHNQQAMWLLDQLMPKGVSFNVSGAVRILGNLDRAALHRSFENLMARHEVLRMTFHIVDGEPKQKVHEQLPLPIKEVDAANWTEETLQSNLEEHAFRSFDLGHEPAFRVVLFKRSEEETVALIAVHHIITDFWSMTLLASEIMTFYSAERRGEAVTLPPLPATYTDFARWRNDALSSADGERHWEYWRDQFSGELPILNLPADRPRKPIQTFRGETQHLRIDSELTRRLKDLSAANSGTLYMTLLAAFQTLLHRYSGQTDILVGSAMAGRTHPDLAHLMGYFVNPVGMRADFSDDPGFNTLLNRVRKTVLDALDHQEYPPALLAQRLNITHRDASRPPLFETTFIFEKAHVERIRDLNSVALGIPGTRLSMGDLSLESMSLLRQPSQFDLTLMMAETGDSLSAAFIYNPDLFDPSTISRFAGHFQTLLDGITSTPDRPLSTLPLLTPPELTLLDRLNATDSDYPHILCLHQLIEEQVEKTPDAVAVVFHDQQWTYRELDKHADKIATILRRQGVKPETLVGLCVDRSPEMLAALLGIHKAGGAYVPLDPTFPYERLAFMLEDSSAPVLITQTSLASPFPGYEGAVILLDKLDEQLPNNKKSSSRKKPTSDNLAYVLYTSGSTGKPKGVMIPHRALVNFLISMQKQPGLSADDTLLAVTTLSFDIAGLELYLPLITGAKVVIADRETVYDPGLLMQEMERVNATVMQATPATWRMLIEAGWQGRKELKILCGGEALPADLANQLLERGCELWNLYGPTETTIWSTLYQVERSKLDESTASVSIGRPIANTKIHILDSHGQPVPIGVTGELYIGGDGLARGYLNRPELTEERFIPHPAALRAERSDSGDEAGGKLYKTGDLARWLSNGNIEFLGRMDQQVKIRGFRIEIGEVETVLSQHPNVGQAVVVARRETSSEASLVAYVVSTSGEEEADAGQLREFLRTKLPEYMIPSAFVTLASFPMTPNGKVDRKALPALSNEHLAMRAEYVAPRTAEEEAIAKICAEALDVERVGVHDNFFDLGGNSLVATRLVFQLQEHFQVKLPLVRLFESPTVAGLAAAIADAKNSPTSDENLFDAISLDELKSQVSLDENIHVNGSKYTPVENWKHVFLTGGTGFLGAYLLTGLLSKNDVTVHCLIRAEDEEEGLRRLKKNLDYYQLWDDSFASRVRIVIGNLDRPRFGLSVEQFDALANELDVVYHNGAMVNFVYPYHALKPVNVDSTQDVLRLASAGKLKPVHFISSLSVFMKGDLRENGLCYEGANLEEVGVPFGGYGQSKWVAEGLMRIAAERGIPITIFRPDNILGDRANGILNTSDMTYSLVRAIFKMGSVPDVEIMGGIVPVDFVSDAILHLSRQPESFGKTFHLSSRRQSNFVEIFKMISEMGMPIRQIPFEQWKKDYYDLVKRFPDEAFHAFLPLINQVGKHKLSLPRLDLTNTLAGLEGTSIHCPAVDEKLVETYVKYFIRSGLLLPVDT